MERKNTRLLDTKSQQGPDGSITVGEAEVEEVAVFEAEVEEVEEASSRASVISATSGVIRPSSARHKAMELAHLVTASAQRKLQL